MEQSTTPVDLGSSEALGPLPHPEHGWTWTDSERRWIRAYVAKEVAAERERCASIAENYGLGTPEGRAIAACIRGA